MPAVLRLGKPASNTELTELFAKDISLPCLEALCYSSSIVLIGKVIAVKIGCPLNQAGPSPRKQLNAVLELTRE
jgi:hypothetical protein